MKVITMATNQYIIKDKENRRLYFQSYDTIVARIDYCGRAGEVYLVNGATDFSRTTSKYLYKFLAENSLIYPEFCNKKGIMKLIGRGEIVSRETI